MKEHGKGFTIVELLIVIVVIAILAAITIVAYNGIQDRARASSVSSALNQASKQIKLWQVDNPSTSPASLATVGVSDEDEVSYQYNPGSNGTYCITATNSTTSYKITESTQPTPGGCPGHGQAGVAAITNMITNPSVETNTSSIFGIKSGNVSQSSAQSHEGSYSVRVVPSGAEIYSGMGIECPGSNGTDYTFSAYVYTESTQRINFAADCLSSNTTPTLNPGWQRLTVSGTRADSRRLLVRAADQTGIAFYVDGIMFTEGNSNYTYADGSSSNWIWNGTAHSSTSTGPPL